MVTMPSLRSFLIFYQGFCALLYPNAMGTLEFKMTYVPSS